MGELASNGNVVAAIDHAFGALVTVYPDGRVVLRREDVLSVDGTEEAFDRSAKEMISVWTSDARFVLDQLEKMTLSSDGNLFAGKLDLSRGLSWTFDCRGNAVQTCWAEPRCIAGLAMDAWLIAFAENVFQNQVEQPFMFMWSENWSSEENRVRFDRLYDRFGNRGDDLTIAGSRHYDFSDLPLLSPLSPWFGLKGTIEGHRVLEIISRTSRFLMSS